jgi:hypothetical protein
MLIASAFEVVVVSRRLDHANPIVTLTVYAHVFKKDSDAAANAVDAILRTPGEHEKL